MSVENFFLRYPADESLKSTMSKEMLPSMSPIAALAAKLAKGAGDGLREITRRLEDSDLAFRLDQKSFQRLNPDDGEKMTINYAGVIFGVSVSALEDCVVSGTFDLNHWCSLYNTVISGTQLSTMQQEKGESIETLSKDNLQKMRDLVRKDKTFATFFESDVNAMPSRLKNILIGSEILPVIRKSILPPYKERAKMLVV